MCFDTKNNKLKRFIMKIFTSKTVKLAIVAVIGLLASTPAFAGEKWSNHTVKVISSPTGGQVYSNVKLEEFNTDQLQLNEYVANLTIKGMDLSTLGGEGTLYAASLYSKPTDGVFAAGFAKDQDNNGIYNPQIDTEFSVPTSVTDDNVAASVINLSEPDKTYENEADAIAAGFPTQPTSTYFAIFAKAVAYVKDWQGGTVETSKIANNIGDAVTFKAVAGQGLNEDGSSFPYYFIKWTDADGNEISTDEEYTISEITEPTKIYAVFSDTKPSSGINGVIVDNQEADGPAYDVFGRRVTSEYKGIVIRNGKKYIQR